MTSDDYQSVDKVKQALGSIARLGRAAAVHLALACQRASGSTISSDLKNNIQMSVLLGGFDEGASQLMFEKDISNLAKPDIKGRGFIGSGNEIIETQTYFTQPENDWVFDDKQKLSYNNPVYLEQCKIKGITIEDNGWVKQHPLDEEVEEEIIEEEFEGTNDNDFNDNEDSKINQDIDDLFKKSDTQTSDDTKKEETPKKSIDDIKMSDDMDDLFSNPFGEQSSTRKKVEDALDIAEPNTNNIKLNIDNTYSEAPSTKLKLHINKKK